MTLGKRLRIARNYAKLTQLELANKANVGQGTISKIERGDQDKTTMINTLASIMRVNSLWLETGKGFMLEDKNTLNEEKSKYNHLEDNVRPQSIKPNLLEVIQALEKLNKKNLDEAVSYILYLKAKQEKPSSTIKSQNKTNQ